MYLRRTTSFLYLVFVCVCCVFKTIAMLKRNIYTNHVYANCIPNEFDVIIIIMMVWTTCTTRTHKYFMCTNCCTYQIDTYMQHVQSFQFERISSSTYSRFTSKKKTMPHSNTDTILSYIINVDWDRMWNAISCEKQKWYSHCTTRFLQLAET